MPDSSPRDLEFALASPRLRLSLFRTRHTPQPVPLDLLSEPSLLRLVMIATGAQGERFLGSNRSIPCGDGVGFPLALRPLWTPSRHTKAQERETLLILCIPVQSTNQNEGFPAWSVYRLFRVYCERLTHSLYRTAPPNMLMLGALCSDSFQPSCLRWWDPPSPSRSSEADLRWKIKGFGPQRRIFQFWECSAAPRSVESS